MRRLPFDYAVRNLGRSPRRFLAILLGNALVVLLIIAAAAFIEGMRSSLSIRNDSRNVILLATGSEESIERSEIPATTPGILSASLPGIHSVAGVAFVSPEILSGLIFFENEGETEELRAVVRGITPEAFLIHERVEIVEGRAPQSGRNEIIAGRLAAEKLSLPASALAIGESLFFEGEPWTVVGHFQARGTVMDAELWTPLTDLQVATKRDGLSCVVIRLGDAEFADVDAFTKMRVDLELSAIAETEYYASLLRFYQPIQIMIWATAILIALAGILGGLNTLYSAFAARAREIGMLQSLGYPRRAIVLSLVQEAILAAAIAVFVAIAAAKVLLDGIAVSFSMGVFELTLNSTVLTAGATVGLFLGFLGALPPAWRCLRMPIPEALKSL
ncbi:ABC transporter permease [bacterium]|nr:ABC transporter permease [bacterium]